METIPRKRIVWYLRQTVWVDCIPNRSRRKTPANRQWTKRARGGFITKRRTRWGNNCDIGREGQKYHQSRICQKNWKLANRRYIPYRLYYRRGRRTIDTGTPTIGFITILRRPNLPPYASTPTIGRTNLSCRKNNTGTPLSQGLGIKKGTLNRVSLFLQSARLRLIFCLHLLHPSVLRPRYHLDLHQNPQNQIVPWLLFLGPFLAPWWIRWPDHCEKCW